MSETVQRDEDLLRLIAGYMPAFTISAALRLGILEAVGESGMTATELARVTSTHAPSLTRVLRALAALGLLGEDPPGTFRLSPRGTSLRRGEPGSLYGIATVMLDESMWGAWPALDHRRTRRRGSS
jgi:orsellinic acid C2-O-methyltransferase